MFKNTCNLCIFYMLKIREIHVKYAQFNVHVEYVYLTP